ncbi:centromere protein T isoform X2 [Bufo gargarizans]|nr:centromere protein T isoform X2 [Bufo gargarizans]XP_044125558.1 centromere protein T isoform X2 [Bufo gargarizans]XP_044125559.1 centromere protein T isoform X2 [Bufo gargarizans]
MEDSTEDNLTTRSLLKGILATELVRRQVTRSTIQRLSQQSSTSYVHQDESSSSPSMNLRSKMRARARRSLGKSALEVSVLKKNVATNSNSKKKSAKKGSHPIMEDLDTITPRTLLKKIIQNEDEVSILVSQRSQAAADDDKPQEDSPTERLSSLGSVNLSLPDLQDTEHVTVFKTSRKKRKMRVSEFEREVDERLPKNKDKQNISNDPHDNFDVPSLFVSSYTISGSTDNKLDISAAPESTFKRGLLRRPNKVCLVSLDDFEQGVEDKYQQLKGSQECFIEPPEGDKSDANEMALLNTVLYAQSLRKEANVSKSDREQKGKRKHISSYEEIKEANELLEPETKNLNANVHPILNAQTPKDKANDGFRGVHGKVIVDGDKGEANEDGEEVEAGGDSDEEARGEEVEAGGDSDEEASGEEVEAGGDIGEEDEASGEEVEAGGDIGEEDEASGEEVEAGGDIGEEDEASGEEVEAGGDIGEEDEASGEEVEAGGDIGEEDEASGEEVEAGGDIGEEDEASGEEVEASSDSGEEDEASGDSGEVEAGGDIGEEVEAGGDGAEVEAGGEEAAGDSGEEDEGDSGEEDESDSGEEDVAAGDSGKGEAGDDLNDVQSSMRQNKSSLFNPTRKSAGVNEYSHRMQRTRLDEENGMQTAESIYVHTVSRPEETSEPLESSGGENLDVAINRGMAKKKETNKLILSELPETPAYIKFARFVSTTKPAVSKKIQRKRSPKAKKTGTVFSSSQIKQIFTHHSQVRVSKDALEDVEKCLDLYVNQLAVDLSTYTAHANRKTVTRADLELLMKRQRLVTDVTSLNVLIEKHLPLECRALLIPCAMSGNKVFPKM